MEHSKERLGVSLQPVSRWRSRPSKSHASRAARLWKTGVSMTGSVCSNNSVLSLRCNVSARRFIVGKVCTEDERRVLRKEWRLSVLFHQGLGLRLQELGAAVLEGRPDGCRVKEEYEDVCTVSPGSCSSAEREVYGQMFAVLTCHC